MRVNSNIGDLIHNSSEHRDVTSAFVEIHFQYIHDFVKDENRYEVIPGETFSVKREIRRSGESLNTTSNYYINDEKIEPSRKLKNFLKMSIKSI